MKMMIKMVIVLSARIGYNILNRILNRGFLTNIKGY
jgi:hypothetical protein